MILNTLRLSQTLEKSRSTIFESLNRSFRWRWSSIFLLGLVSSVLVNAVFDLKYHRPLLSFGIAEYYNALIVSFFLLEGTRWISKVLNKKVPWEVNKNKRLLFQLGLNLVFCIIVLNSLVIGITYIFYDSFYALQDMLLINISVIPLTLIFSTLSKERAISVNPSSTKIFKWNWVSIVLLGVLINTVVNIVFDYKYQRSLVSLSLEEYLNAIVGAAIFLGGTRWVSKKLNNKFPWEKGVVKRLCIQLGLNLLFIIALTNILVIGITYVFYGGFYEFDELAVINLSVVSLTFFFASIDSGIYFFKNWKSASGKSGASINRNNPIQLSMGRSHYLIAQENIRCAISKSGLVVIVTNDERKLPYPHSLESLMHDLDPNTFFRANRQIILNRSIVKSIKALDYGKVEVSLIPIPTNGQPNEVIISRTRASTFRKWLKFILI